MYCVNCGAAVMSENNFCVSCGKPLSGAAAQMMPQSVGGGAAVAPAAIPSLSFGGYAGVPGALAGIGFWPRAGARIIDMIVHYVIYFFTGFFFAFMLGIISAASHSPLQPMLAKMGEFNLTAFLLALLGTVAYHTVMEGGAGATLGKLAIGAVVMQEDGTPCRVKSAFIRTLAYFVDSLFFGIIGYLEMNKSPQQQRHGDHWGHTLVVARAQAPAGIVAGGGRFVAIFVLACMADAATAILGLSLKLI